MENQAAPTEGPTPGSDQLIVINLGSSQLRARRPSRGDEAEIQRRFVRKLMQAAMPMEDAARIDVARMILDRYDGGNLHAEAQLEVLLLPRIYGGVPQSVGESAPAHWYRDVVATDGTQLGRVVSFDNVPTEEFERGARELAAAIAQKKSDVRSPQPTSTGSAPNQSSG